MMTIPEFAGHAQPKRPKPHIAVRRSDRGWPTSLWNADSSLRVRHRIGCAFCWLQATTVCGASHPPAELSARR